MKERPIIFNGAMVRAILSGDKTQTRRVIRRQPFEWESHLCYVPRKMIGHYNLLNKADIYESNPFGIPGDRLWVRETFACLGAIKDNYKSGIFRADDPDAHVIWKPSIHMPRKFSRINLEITNVRVERIKDISEQDAQNEGLIDNFISPGDGHSASYHFVNLWNSINEKRGFGWNENPWVWVIEFEVIK